MNSTLFLFARSFVFFVLCTLIVSAGEVTWTDYESVPSRDGKLRIRALWQKSAPAYDILDDVGTVTKLADPHGATYEFCVLVENIGQEEIVVPSWTQGGRPVVGIPINGQVVVPYVISPSKPFGRLTVVDSPVMFRPVKLRPGESARLPIYYRNLKEGETLPIHWFYYGVAETIAMRHGWWAGALACKAEEFIPD